MKIDVIRMSNQMHESSFRVEVDGVLFESGVRYEDLPEVIDRIYAGKEKSVAEKLIKIAENMKDRAAGMRNTADELTAQAEQLEEIYRDLQEELK